MARWFLRISYRGAPFSGWQRQPNAPSVQQVLEEALATLSSTPAAVVGAGRTDAGVHATGQMAHWDGPDALPPDFQYRLNALLPPAVAVTALFSTHGGAPVHARYSARQRAYLYRICPGKDPFKEGQVWRLDAPLSLPALQQASALTAQWQDFASFCTAGGNNRTTLCRIDHALWQQVGPELHFSIRADRFLRGMVRALVGTHVLLGQGKLDADGLQTIAHACDRRRAGPAAPPHGLYLTEVLYPDGCIELWEPTTLVAGRG